MLEDNALTFYDLRKIFPVTPFLRDSFISVSATSVRGRRQRSLKRSASRVSSASQVICQSSNSFTKISDILTQVEHVLCDLYVQ